MKKWDGYFNGINLGGWLSQCKEYTTEHYDTFIREPDFKVISDNGYDHVRLPIDYNLIMSKDGELIPEGFKYIDNCYKWARENNLNMIIDLHKTLGYSFDSGENEDGFFDSEKYQGYFYKIWDEIARRYSRYHPHMAFELLNEVTEKRFNDTWMRIAEKAVGIIRNYSKDIKILLGGYYNNSVVAVKDLAEPFDENIVYNFHCYEPLCFTHAGAYWIPWMPADFRLKYPITRDEYLEAIQTFPDEPHIIADLIPEAGFNAEFFEHIFKEAIETAEKRNVLLYCGEFGVIEYIDKKYKDAWFRDIHEAFSKNNIGHAVWSYRKMDFGLFE